MPAGQPTKYRPEYCEKVVEFMSDGSSIVAFAAHLNVTRETVFEWARVHPKFSDSLNLAREKCQAWWEDQGKNSLIDQTRNGDSDRFNDRLWKMNMVCRFQKDWSEKVKADENISDAQDLLKSLLGNDEG